MYEEKSRIEVIIVVVHEDLVEFFCLLLVDAKEIGFHIFPFKFCRGKFNAEINDLAASSFTSIYVAYGFASPSAGWLMDMKAAKRCRKH